MRHGRATPGGLGAWTLALGLLLAAGCASNPARTTDRGGEVRHADDAAAPAQGPGGYRGVVTCDEDTPCYADAPPLSAQDVTVTLMRVAPDDSLKPLANGEALRSGERFTVLVHATRDAHLYLFHRAPDGRVDELVRASGLLGGDDCDRSNRFSAGQAIRLPDHGAHYSLRGAAGIEWLQAVVSAMPICEDSAASVDYTAYRDLCGRDGRLCLPVFAIRHLVET